jgi:hypothetical protein
MSKKQSNEIAGKIQNLLGSYAQEVNEWLQFSQKNSPLNAVRFVQVLVLGWLKKKKASLNELAHSAKDLGLQISGSALHERIDARAALLLAGVLNLALRDLRQTCPLGLKKLESFRAIYVTDSSQIALPSVFAALFKGNQGNAMLKLQVTWDYLHGNLVALDLEDGKSADQKSRLPLQAAQKDCLELFDLGYFKQEHLGEMAAKGAYFVSRYKSKTGLYQEQAALPFDLVRSLKTLLGNEAEYALLVGGRLRLPLRLLVRRLAPEAAEARRRKAKKIARKQGQTLTDAYLYLLGWDILLSNLPKESWSLAEIFDLYPIRFQIEWVFRIWKDQLGLDELGDWSIERLLCQLYAHLLAAVLSHLLTAHWRWGEFEYSFLKSVQIIQTAIPGLMRCLARSGWGVAAWLKRLEGDFHHFARKTKRRKSPSTLQTIYNWDVS